MGGKTAAVWSQTNYRFRNDDGSETTATWMAAANTTPPNIPVDTIFRLRILIQETAGSNQAETPTFNLEYRVNTGGGFGAWTAVGIGANSPDHSVDSPNVTLRTPTTQQLGAGTFNDGDLDESGNPQPLNATAGNDQYEMEYCITFPSAAASGGYVYEFRSVFGTTAFTTYNAVPSVTVTSGPSLQTLTQTTRFDNTSTFNTHLIVLGPGPDQDLTQTTRFDNTSTFNTHLITTGPVDLTQTALFDDSTDTFYTHEVTVGPAKLTQTALFDDSTDTFYTHKIQLDGGEDQYANQTTIFTNSSGIANQHQFQLQKQTRVIIIA